MNKFEDKKYEFYVSWFYLGWRPTLGWVGVFAATMQFILIPIVAMAFPMISVPDLDSMPILTLVLAHLGLRTVEKISISKKE